MPMSNLKGRLSAVPIERFVMEDFAGGLDIESDPERLDSRYVIQATNVDLADGKVRARGGVTLMPTTGIVASYFYHSPVLGFVYAIAEVNPAAVNRTTDPDGGVWVSVSAGAPNFGNGSDCVEFNGVLVFVCDSGVFSLNAAGTWTLLNATVTGRSITAWQNKLWVAGTGSRVFFCKAGDHTTWDALDYVDIREGSGDAPNLAVHATQAMDLQGRPALIVTKRRSVHRIHDATTGAFTTLTAETGPYHRRAIASGGGKTCFIADDGIYETDGLSVPRVISSRIRPLFLPSTISNASGTMPAPVFHNGRFIFSFPGWSIFHNSGFAGSGGCVHVVYDPQTDTFSVNQWARFCFDGGAQGVVMAWLSIKSGTRAGNLYAGVNRSTEPLYKVDTNTDDAGTASTAIVQTPFMELAGGMRFRIHRLRLIGRLVDLAAGTPFTLRVRIDGSTSDSIVRTLTADGSNALNVQPYDFNRLGDARSVSFVFELAVKGFGFGYPADDAYIKLPFKNQIDRLVVEYTPTGRN
jgi:hypothetical protein